MSTASNKTQLPSAGQKVKYSSGQGDRAHHEALMPFPGTALWKHPEERSHISGTADTTAVRSKRPDPGGGGPAISGALL